MDTSLIDLLQQIKVIYLNSNDTTSQDIQVLELLHKHFGKYGNNLLAWPTKIYYPRDEYSYRLLGLFIRAGCAVSYSDIRIITWITLECDRPIKSLICVFECMDKTMLCNWINEMIIIMFITTGATDKTYDPLLRLLHVVEIINKDFKIYPKVVERYLEYHKSDVYKYNISALSDKIIPKSMWKERFIDTIKSSKCEKIISNILY